MTTIINTPGGVERESDSGTGIILGTIVAIVVVVLFFVYALPALRNSQTPTDNPAPNNTNITVTTPSPVKP